MIEYFLFGLIFCSENGNFNNEDNDVNSVKNGVSFRACLLEDDDYIVPGLLSKEEVSDFFDRVGKGLLDFGANSDESRLEGNYRIINKNPIESSILIDNSYEPSVTAQFNQHQTDSSNDNLLNVNNSFSKNHVKINDISNSDDLRFNDKRQRIFIGNSNNRANKTGNQYYNGVNNNQNFTSSSRKTVSDINNSLININKKLSLESRCRLNRSSSKSSSSFNNVPSISNVSTVNFYESQRFTSNQFIWKNVYYDEIKGVTCYNYKKYEDVIDVYFKKLEECLNDYLVDIYESEADDEKYKIDWDKSRCINEIFNSSRATPFKYIYINQGTYAIVLNNFNVNPELNLELYEKSFWIKFKNIYKEINDFLVSFRNSLYKNENQIENRKRFLKVVSKISDTKYEENSEISELECRYILYKLDACINDFGNDIEDDESYNYCFPEVKEFLEMYNKEKKYFEYTPFTIHRKYFMVELIRGVTYAYVGVNNKKPDFKVQNKLVLEIRLMIYDMFKVFDFYYIYLFRYIIECLRRFYSYENDVKDLNSLKYYKIFDFKSLDLFRFLCFKSVKVPDIFYDFNRNVFQKE